MSIFGGLNLSSPTLADAGGACYTTGASCLISTSILF
jgi:hypothetical protein